jgi:hypothetical protein
VKQVGRQNYRPPTVFEGAKLPRSNRLIQCRATGAACGASLGDGVGYWCIQFHLRHCRRDVPAAIRAFQRTLTDIARRLRRKSLNELMRKSEMHFVTHFSELLIFA